MQPDDIIESYVSDVVRRLPRRQRRDVGSELRSLLSEDLTGRAADLGRPADEPMAMDLLADFGRPQDVADRYRPAGFTVIRPADAPGFARLALGGVALQWAITVPAVFDTAPGADDWLTRLSTWWLSWGLGSFWWPGFLISVTLIAAVIRHRRTVARGGAGAEADAGTPMGTSAIRRSVLDPDRVSRPGLALSLGFWALGASALIALPSLPTLAPGLPEPLLDAFALEADFVRVRAPWVLVLWAGSFALEVAVLVTGRTTRTTRRISIVMAGGWLVLLTSLVMGGPVFVAAPADGVVRLSLLGVIAVVVIDLVATIRREAVSTRPPATSRAAR